MKAKAIIMAAVLAMAITYNAHAQQVTTFKGEGIQNTKPFTMKGAWSVSWTATATVDEAAMSGFQIYHYTGTGQLIGVLANQHPVGSGESYFPKGGKYYFNVNAWNCKWVLTVTAED